MEHFDVATLNTVRLEAGQSYLEFLRAKTLSAGLYVLAAGEQDPQQPHTEDEVYYVIQGKARFDADGQDRAVAAGSVLFVAAGVPHHFYSIGEELSILVLFAPPAGSLSGQDDQVRT